LQARLITATLHGLMAQWHLAPGSFSWSEAAAELTASRPRHERNMFRDGDHRE
jgi:hypothetical protein